MEAVPKPLHLFTLRWVQGAKAHLCDRSHVLDFQKARCDRGVGTWVTFVFRIQVATGSIEG